MVLVINQLILKLNLRFIASGIGGGVGRCAPWKKTSINITEVIMIKMTLAYLWLKTCNKGGKSTQWKKKT